MARLLDEDIDELEALDKQRERCRDLLEDGAQVLVAWADALGKGRDKAGDQDDEDWDSAKDDVERAVVYRSLNRIAHGSVLGLAQQKRVQLREVASSLRAELSTGLDSLYKHPSSRDEEPPPRNDRLPVFRACQVVQALVEDPADDAGPFCLASINCLYRLMTEIYRIEDPEWRIGGVRASLQAPQSAFMTRESIRSILRLHESVSNTALLLKELERATDAWRAARKAPRRWRTHASELRETGFRTSLRARWPHLLKPPTEDQPCADAWTDAAGPEVLSRLRHHWETFRGSLDSLKTEAPKVVVHGSSTSALEAAPPAQGTPPTGGSDPAADQSAAQIPTEAPVSRAVHDRVIELLNAVYQTANNRLDSLDHAASALTDAAASVLEIVRPTVVFLEGILLAEISADPHRTAVSPDAAQAAFAAAALAEFERASGSFDPGGFRLRAATELAVSALSERGPLPSRTPFDVAGKGYRLLPQSAETIRALCDLLRLSNTDCSSETARKLVRYFLETRAVRPREKPGWHSDAELRKVKTEVWASGLAFFALLDLCLMLDEQINQRVLTHFTVRQPRELNLSLDELFLPDAVSALNNPGDPQKSIGDQLQRMRAHVEGTASSANDFSVVLYGPPGTGKSTLLEAVAKSSNSPLLEVTPSDILIGGKAEIERHTRLVFSALSMLSRCVILFDEFDSILYARSEDGGPPSSEFQFLTPGLLPKLKRLHDRAEKQQLAYALATNYVGHLDRAAIRSGRFDRQLGVFPPDILSRVYRLAIELQRCCDNAKKYPDTVEPVLTPEQQQRAITVIRESRGQGMATLGKRGWFTAPKPTALWDPSRRSLFGFIFEGGALPNFGDKEERTEKAPDATKDRLGHREWTEWLGLDKLEDTCKAITTAEWNTFGEAVADLSSDHHPAKNAPAKKAPVKKAPAKKAPTKREAKKSAAKKVT
jgi:hypothetical protein